MSIKHPVKTVRRIAVFYHNDLDGVAAAAVIHAALKPYKAGEIPHPLYRVSDDVESIDLDIKALTVMYPRGPMPAHWPLASTSHVVYRHVQYKTPMPEVHGADLILFVDFTPTAGDVAYLREHNPGAHIVVIDHHKIDLTHVATYVDLLIHDYNMSGAGLTWQVFNGRMARVPDSIAYAQDYDLWRFDLPGSRDVTACLNSLPTDTPTAVADFPIWGSADDWEGPGSYIRTALEGIAEHQAKKADLRCITVDGTRYAVPVVNCTAEISRTGDILGKMYPEEPFSATWFMRDDGKVVVSLRSREDGADVSEIAKAFGGGGHTHAAGCVLSLGEAITSGIVPCEAISIGE